MKKKPKRNWKHTFHVQLASIRGASELQQVIRYLAGKAEIRDIVDNDFKVSYDDANEAQRFFEWLRDELHTEGYQIFVRRLHGTYLISDVVLW